MMLAGKKIVFLLLIIFVPASLPAQSVIKGTVINAKTGEPLPGTNIYLANTTLGTAAASDGSYRLEAAAEAGVYDLVISFVGFNKKVTQVELTGDTTITVNATLQPRTIQMDKLTVTGSDARWRERLEFFKEEFIGTTVFAEKTKMLNPKVLRFKISAKGQFVANAVKPLHIVNHALGYLIYIELDQFVWSQDGERGFYKIYPKYTKLTATSEDQLENWQENRREAYVGSLRHFLKKLYHNEASNEFTVSPRGNLEPLSESETTFKLLGRVPMELAAKLKGFKLLNSIVVIYGKVGGVFNYEADGQKKAAMAATNDNHIFYVNKKGLPLDPLSIITGGYWGEQRLANSLPLDYHLNE